MYVVSERPHQIYLPSSGHPSCVSINSDFSQNYVFISTSNSVNLYAANLVFDLISQYSLANEQLLKFGSIVDIKSSQSLPLLALVTNKNKLLILTYEKNESVISLDKSNSDASISTSESDTNFPNFLVSAELHHLLAFNLDSLSFNYAENCVPSNLKPSESDDAKPSNIIDGRYVCTAWNNSSLIINVNNLIFTIDFDKIACNKIKTASSDNCTDQLTLTVDSGKVHVEDKQIGTVVVSNDNNDANNSIMHGHKTPTYSRVESYNNHIFYKDSLGRLIAIGYLGTTVIAEKVDHFAISSTIAYSITSSENNSNGDKFRNSIVKLSSYSKINAGDVKDLNEISVDGQVRMLSWCPRGQLLAIIYKRAQFRNNNDDFNYYLTFFCIGSHGFHGPGANKIQVNGVLNIIWASHGLRFFVVTLNSVYLFDIFRSTGWYTGHFYNNRVFIGPSAILALDNDSSIITSDKLDVNKHLFRYDYPLSTCSFWPFVLAFISPSSDCLLIRSYNDALLVCSRRVNSVDRRAVKALNNKKLEKILLDNNIWSSTIRLSRYWQLLEYPVYSEKSNDNEFFPCCWIDEDLIISVGLSEMNALNHTLKICKISCNSISLLAQLKIRRSPIIVRRIDFIKSFDHLPFRNTVLFYLVTKFDKVEIYKWIRGTDTIQFISQIDLTFPDDIFTGNAVSAAADGVEAAAENSSLGHFPKIATSRLSSRSRSLNYLNVKSASIRSINIVMDETKNSFIFTIISSGEVYIVSIVNGQVVSGAKGRIGQKLPTQDGVLSSHLTDYLNIKSQDVLPQSSQIEANNNCIVGNKKDYDASKQLFDFSKHHFEKKGKLATLNLLEYKDKVANSVLMRICRMALEYNAVDESVISIFEEFAASKDYLNASLVLICIQSIVGINEMSTMYLKPLLLGAIQELGHKPSLARLVNQLKRILQVNTNATIMSNEHHSDFEITSKFIKAVQYYVFEDFLGLIRVLVLLELPLVKVLSTLNFNWRLSDCETHFGTEGVTLSEMLTSINRQFFTNYFTPNDQSLEFIGKKVDRDGWSVSTIFNLLLPLHYACREAGVDGMAFVIALSIGDKKLAQLSVNDHIAREIDKLDSECSKCGEARLLIALVM